jgi:putative tricarboxylic transport membrane protein
MEEYLRRAMALSRRDPSVFFTQPISSEMLLATALLLLTMVAPAVRRQREGAFRD